MAYGAASYELPFCYSAARTSGDTTRAVDVRVAESSEAGARVRAAVASHCGLKRCLLRPPAGAPLGSLGRAEVASLSVEEIIYGRRAERRPR